MSEQPQTLEQLAAAGWQPVTAAADQPSEGYWEDRGIAGKVWHPAQGGQERTRTDVSVLGIPPELAAVATVPIMRAFAAPALSMAERGLMAAKGIVEQTATPIIKYEATKWTLERFGVPQSLAIPTAMMLSGYRGKGRVAQAEAPTTASGPARVTPEVSPPTTPPAIAAAEPAASAAMPATPVVQPPPAVPQTGAGPVRLTLPEFKLAQQLVRNGLTKNAALAAVNLVRRGLTLDQAVAQVRQGSTP